MKLGVVLAAVAGLAGAAYLIFHVGFDAVWGSATSVGWSGFALLCVYGALNLVLLGLAWWLLVPPHGVRSAVTFCWGRSVRESAGEVLPFSHLGGLVIGARATVLRGISHAMAFASTVVDVTVEMLAQIAFVLIGLVALTMDLPGAGTRTVVTSTTLGILVVMLAVGAFLLMQRRGFPVLERIAKRVLPAAAAPAAAVNRAIASLHGSPGRVGAAFVLHFLGWLSGAFGTWLALLLIGHPIGFGSATAIEALLSAARSAAVFVPGAIGVQEAAYAMVMPLFGLSPELGVAVSLLRRGQQVAIGVPVLLSWQLAEGGHAARGEPRRLRPDEA